MEIIEYKGPGHPDSITDSVVEQCATFLDTYYLRVYGKVLHYNVDKAVFLAGDVNVSFGGCIINKHPCFILGGQVSMITEELKQGLIDTIYATIDKILPKLRGFDIEIRCNNVVANLNHISEQALANDTSFGVGYYPLSENEKKVVDIAEGIECIIRRGDIPMGGDYKIMFTPKSITISAPLYAKRVKSKEEYAGFKKQIERWFSKYDNVIFNPDFDNGFPYLTICGSSIECGDDGQVGRGNRYNGLITPCKPMTIEAYCGKNNRNHVGKLYQKLASEKAKEIALGTGRYTEVILVSKIGHPISEYEIYISHPND